MADYTINPIDCSKKRALSLHRDAAQSFVRRNRFCGTIVLLAQSFLRRNRLCGAIVCAAQSFLRHKRFFPLDNGWGVSK